MDPQTNYQPDFEADRIPAWFIDSEETIAYHLYPNCGYINQHSERGLSKTTVPWRASKCEGLTEWKKQIKSNRHMCSHCISRFEKDWSKQIDWDSVV